MKHKYTMIGTALIIASNAYAADDMLPYAGTIGAHNIIAARHSIAAQAMGTHGTTTYVQTTQNVSTPNNIMKPDEYGTMRYYGEYGDDTGIIGMRGRGGGDENANHYVKFAWQHFDEDVEFNSRRSFDSDMDIAMLSLGYDSGYGRTKNMNIEMFGGYIGGHTENSELDIDSDGGYVGSYIGYSDYGANIGAMFDIGVMGNTATSPYDNKNFRNIWFGITAGASYDINLTNGFILRPGVSGGFAWVYLPTYTSDAGHRVSNTNFTNFDLTPSIGLVKAWESGWSVGAHAAYVMNFDHGAHLGVGNVHLAGLAIDDYFDFGANVEHTIENFTIGLNIGYHNGGRTGWNGGAKLKYVF